MKKGYIYILLCSVLFSTMEIALKLVSDKFNPIQLTFLRFFIGSLILMPLAIKGLRRRKIHLKAGDFAFFALTGLFSVVVSMILYQMAILYSQASVVAVLFSCNPVFVVLFAFMILREKIYKHTIISLIVSITGIVVIMNPLHMSGRSLGIMLTILSAVAFAVYSVIGRKRSEYYGGIALTCFSFLLGSIEMILLIIITKISFVSFFMTNTGLKSFASVPILQGINWNTLPSLIYIGVFVTGLGYGFYFLAIETTSAVTASLAFFIKPALAPILASIIIHEAITFNMFIGILLIIAGSLISFIPGFKLRKNKGLREDIKEDIEIAKNELKAEIDEVTIKP